MQTTNLSALERQQMLDFLGELKKQAKDDHVFQQLHRIEKALTHKKYGLLWEEHREIVEEQLKNNLPIFVEDENRALSVAQNFAMGGGRTSA